MVRCVECGFLFDPGRDADELQELYDDQYFSDYPGVGDYSADEAQRRTEAKKRIAWLKRFVPSGSIFEIGAAAGYFLDEARTAGYSVAGVEPAPAVSGYARERFGLDIKTGFLEDADLPEGRFDAICAFHVLEHVHDPLEVLKDVRASLKNDGYLFLEIPNIESGTAVHDGAKWFHLDQPNHVAFYNPEQLEGLLSKAGIELLETDTVSEYHYYRPLLMLRPRSIVGRSLKRVRTGLNQGKILPAGHPLMRVTARASN
ncbi:MAG: class I SAM-dependent methyltransferase [Solirubrobacterales bacterium]